MRFNAILLSFGSGLLFGATSYILLKAKLSLCTQLSRTGLTFAIAVVTRWSVNFCLITSFTQILECRQSALLIDLHLGPFQHIKIGLWVLHAVNLTGTSLILSQGNKEKQWNDKHDERKIKSAQYRKLREEEGDIPQKLGQNVYICRPTHVTYTCLHSVIVTVHENFLVPNALLVRYFLLHWVNAFAVLQDRA